MPRVHPRHAVSYFQGRNRKANAVPAILALFGLLVLLLVIRSRSLPTPSEAVTLALGAGVVVGIGAIAPVQVAWVLAALLVAGAIGAAQPIAAVLGTVQAKVAGLDQLGR